MGIAGLVTFLERKDHENFQNETFTKFILSLELDVTTETIIVTPLIVLEICITGFFVPPVLLLLYIQTRGFLAGKTTMERFGRVSND